MTISPNNYLWKISLMSVFCLFSPQAKGQHFLTDGLVAYYPFNGNANDESGNGRLLENTGAMLTTDRFGKTNSAFSFDGSSSMLLQTNPPEDSLILFNGCTLSCWVNLVEDARNYSLVRKDGDASMVIVNEQTRANSFYMEARGEGGVTFSTYAEAPPLGRWCMLTASWDGTSFAQYIDGQQVVNTQYADNSVTPDAPISIGRSPIYIEPLLGMLDDVRIYSRALSASEVRHLYLFERKGEKKEKD